MRYVIIIVKINPQTKKYQRNNLFSTTITPFTKYTNTNKSFYNKKLLLLFGIIVEIRKWIYQHKVSTQKAKIAIFTCPWYLSITGILFFFYFKSK